MEKQPVSSTPCTTFGKIGHLLGAALSWHYNHSIMWAVLHYLFGWLYILFAVCKRYL